MTPTRGPHNTPYRKHIEHRTDGAVRHNGKISGGAGTHIEGRTCLQPVVKDPRGLPYVCACCRIRVAGTSSQPPPRTGIPYFPYSPEQWPVHWVLRTIAQK